MKVYIVVKEGEGRPARILGVYFYEDEADEACKADPEYQEEPDDYGTHVYIVERLIGVRYADE